MSRIAHIARLFLRLLLCFVLAMLGLLAASLLLLLAWHLTPFSLPSPTGPDAVGHTLLAWTDSSRLDPLAPTRQARQLVVSLWYPATPERQARAPYLPPAWIRAQAQDAGLSGLLERRPQAVRSNATEDSPAAKTPGAFPVLVFLPGLGPSAADYTALAENLASHGYVVVAPTPTYSADLVVFPNGQVARATPQGNPPDSLDPQALDRALSGPLLSSWVSDARFTLDRLSQLNQSGTGPLTGHLDLSRVGVLGHSYGGATAVRTCQTDARCRAVADLDGWLYGPAPAQGLRQPFLYISGDPGACDAPCQQASRRLKALEARLAEGGGLLRIHGAQHFNFSDLGLRFLPWAARSLGLVGTVDPREALRLTGSYLTAFFDQALKGTPSKLLQESHSTRSVSFSVVFPTRSAR